MGTANSERAVEKKARDHLFQPGQSGNPSGRPKALLTDVLREALEARDEEGRSKRELIAEKLLALAMDGDVAAIRYIYDRCDGTPVQTVTHQGDPDKPIQVRHSIRPTAAALPSG